jgi:hypothetical protein
MWTVFSSDSIFFMVAGILLLMFFVEVILRAKCMTSFPQELTSTIVDYARGERSLLIGPATGV